MAERATAYLVPPTVKLRCDDSLHNRNRGGIVEVVTVIPV